MLFLEKHPLNVNQQTTQSVTTESERVRGLLAQKRSQNIDREAGLANLVELSANSHLLVV